VAIVITFDRGAVAELTTSPGGPVMRDMLRRANAVRNAALANMRSMGIGQKTGTGQLAGSIVVEPIANGYRVGSRLPYAIFVHEGHGEIRPIRGKFLRWPATSASGIPRRRFKGGTTAAYVYAKRVRPVAGKPFLERALIAAAD
jgi:hypothetical protein